MAEIQPSANTPPAEIKPENSPVAPATPSQPAPQDAVILTKDQHEQLMRSDAVAKTAQQNASKLQNQLDALKRRKVEPLPPLEAQAVATVRSKVASTLISNSKYLPLLEKNPTLAKVLAKNPLDLLDRDEFIDEQDAANQVLDFLDEEMNKLNSTVVAPTTVVPSAPAPKSPNPEDVNPTADDPQGAAAKELAERNSKLPPIKRITNNIASRLKISEPS